MPVLALLLAALALAADPPQPVKKIEGAPPPKITVPVAPRKESSRTSAPISCAAGHGRVSANKCCWVGWWHNSTSGRCHKTQAKCTERTAGACTQVRE